MKTSKKSSTNPQRLPALSQFSAAPKPAAAVPYLGWVKAQGFSRTSGMRWRDQGLVVVFKFPSTPKGMLWILSVEAERFLKVLKRETPPELPPPITPLPSPAAALEVVGYASITLSSPALSTITGAPVFSLPPTKDWEKDYRALWGISYPDQNHPDQLPSDYAKTNRRPD